MRSRYALNIIEVNQACMALVEKPLSAITE
jgi:hypothetical protein